MTYQTSLHSATGQLAVWPTKRHHPVAVEIDGASRMIVVDAIIADLPDHENPDADAKFLVCGMSLGSPGYARITGVEVPFMSLPEPLRAEIVEELSRVAGIAG
jgi:hypothetical protein